MQRGTEGRRQVLKAVICHVKGMTSFLYANGIRMFDYLEFAAGLRGKVRENAARVAESTMLPRGAETQKSSLTAAFSGAMMRGAWPVLNDAPRRCGSGAALLEGL